VAGSILAALARRELRRQSSSHGQGRSAGLPFPWSPAETQRFFNGSLCFNYIPETAEFIESVAGRVRVGAVVGNASLCRYYNMAEVPLGARQRAHTLGFIPNGAMYGRFVCVGKRLGVGIAGRQGGDHM
jgi:hypothetical protein